jgi:hypothetical protein
MSTGRRYVLHFLLSGRGAHVAFGAGQAGAYPYTSPCVAFDAIDGAREERCSSSLLPFLIILFYDDDDRCCKLHFAIYLSSRVQYETRYDLRTVHLTAAIDR